MASVGRPVVLVATSSTSQSRLLARRVREAQDCVCDIATSGHQVLDSASRRVYDLTILNTELTGMDGITVCHRLRQLAMWQRASVMILGAKGQAQLKHRAFYVGATEYLECPFDPLEFVWRVRLQLRHVSPDAVPQRLDCPPHYLDATTRRVHVGERAIALTPSEFKVAWVLASHAGHWVSAEQVLLDALKRPRDPRAIALLHTHMRNLRKKLEQNPHQPELLIEAGGAYQWKQT